MDIVDISDEYVDTYCKCLEDWSGEMAEAGTLKREWYDRKKSQGLRVKLALVWKPFVAGATAPRFRKMAKKPSPGQGRTKVTCFRNGWCPGQNLACERMKRVAAEFGDRVEYAEIDTEDRRNLEEWGICDAIFIDDRMISTGPPPSYDKLKKALRKRLA